MSLAVAMIVKNAADTLERCLLSVRDAVDAIYVTDTGSTDTTVAVAEKCGAQVRHVPWTNNFAAARNTSLSGLQEDWILVLDADDFFPPGEAAKLRAWTQQAKAPVLQLRYDLRPDLTPGPVARLFRNHLGIHYQGMIHEYLTGTDPAFPPAVQLTDIALQHGPTAVAESSEKLQRNLPLLQCEWSRRLEENSQSQRWHIGVELGRALALTHRLAESETVFETVESFMLGSRCPAANAAGMSAVAALVWHLQERGATDRAVQLCASLAQRPPVHPALHLYFGIACFQQKDFLAANRELALFETAVAGPDFCFPVPRDLTGFRLWDLRAQCLLNLGDPAGAATLFARCAETTRQAPEFINKLELARRLAAS